MELTANKQGKQQKELKIINIKKFIISIIIFFFFQIFLIKM